MIETLEPILEEMQELGFISKDKDVSLSEFETGKKQCENIIKLSLI